MKLVLKNCRATFPNYFVPTTVAGEGEPAFGGSFLIPPDHPQFKEIEAAIQQVAKEKWNDKAPAMLKQLKATDKLCLHNGDTKAKYDGYEGNFFISARNRSRPTILDRDKTPLTAQDGKPYSGCYVNVSLDLWCQDNKYGQRVNATLLAVQFFKDGEAFSGGAAFDEGDFETVEEEGLF